MKLLIMILMTLLLTGCAVAEPTPTTTVAQTTAQTETLDATTHPQHADPGTYLPDSVIETETDGAVLAYDPNVEGCVTLYPMGDRMLLLSGYQTSVLTVLEGDDMSVCCRRELDCLLSVEDGSVQVNSQGVAYIDEEAQSVVFLDSSLNETRSVSLPEDVQGNALIAPDWSQVYYCATDAVRAVDLHTGLTRLIKIHKADNQSLTGVYFGGTVLRGYYEDEEYVGRTVYFSAENGETLSVGRTMMQFSAEEERYLTSFEDGTVRVCLTGEGEEAPQMLAVSQTAQLYPLLQQNALVSVEMTESGAELSYLDLGSGERKSAVAMKDLNYISGMTGRDGKVWLLAGFAHADGSVICCWDPEKSLTGDTQSCYKPYSTAADPDEEGLRRCAATAADIGERYGIDVFVWEDALLYQPYDQKMVAEYQVSAYERDLPVLEAALEKFPDGFLQDVAAGTNNEKLTVNLVRSIQGNQETGSLEESRGVQFWVDESAYISLAMDRSLEQTFYHELSHVIDNRVFSTTLAYDAWTELNPDGFEYDYNYVTNQFREDYQYLDGDHAAFIDMYSMSYPKEDRARILEHAMMPGNAALFEPEILQNKLRTICQGIREAFELDGSIDYPWEQYLKEPLMAEE